MNIQPSFSSEHIHKALFENNTHTVAQKIKYAWDLLCDEDNFNEKQRQEAYLYLIFIFDIQQTDKINQTIIDNMIACEHHWKTNPGYIPNKSPIHLHLKAKHMQPRQTHLPYVANETHIQSLFNRNELLDVNINSKRLDLGVNALHQRTIFLSPEERANYRVIISHTDQYGNHTPQARFFKNGKLFSTKDMISHGKYSYAAYTLNANGELSIFSHNGMQDGIAHSSMNAGSPVVSAGELKIIDGELREINTYSGHYHPQLFNTLRALDHFSHRGVNLNRTSVHTSMNPKQKTSLALKSKKQRHSFFSSDDQSISCNKYKTPAVEFLASNKAKIERSFLGFKAHLDASLKTRIKHRLIQVKETITCPIMRNHAGFYTSTKLQQYQKLKTTINNQLTNSLNIDDKRRDSLLDFIQTTREQITNIKKENNFLRKSHNRATNSGRLYRNLQQLQTELNLLERSSNIKDIHRHKQALLNVY